MSIRKSKEQIKKAYNLPSFFLSMLRWYCSAEKLEEIEGYLEEIFHENVEVLGIKKAR